MDTFFLHQRCPPISIYSSLISGGHGGTHVSRWHIYLTGWDLILFLLSYFPLKMVSVMNELHCHRKVVTYLTKILKWLWYDTNTKSSIYKWHFTRAQMSTETPAHSCVSVSSAEFLRIIFFRALQAECFSFYARHI